MIPRNVERRRDADNVSHQAAFADEKTVGLGFFEQSADRLSVGPFVRANKLKSS